MLASTVVQAQQNLMRQVEPNQCQALLKGGVFDEHNVLGSSFQTKVFLNRFCSARYSSFQQASQDSLNLGVPLGSLMAALGFSGTETTFQRDYQTLCSQQDSFAGASQWEAERVRIANANLAQAFGQCVNSTHFVAYATPIDPKQFQLVVVFHPQSGADRARITSLTYNKTGVECDKPPATVGAEGMRLNCRRSDEKQTVQLALNTSEGDHTIRIPAYEPPVPPPAVTSAVGDVVMSLLPPDKFSSQHPGQVWMLCGVPGGQVAPPESAWARLTGGAPLPDCGARYPRAFQNGVTPAAGNTQEDHVGEHTHLIRGRHLEANRGKGFEGSGFKSNSDVDPAWDADFPTMGVTDAGADRETRPKTIIFNFYIRVN